MEDRGGLTPRRTEEGRRIPGQQALKGPRAVHGDEIKVKPVSDCVLLQPHSDAQGRHETDGKRA